MFWKRKPTPTTPEPEPVHIHHIVPTQDPHTELTTDGWQHAHIYHHMINQAQQTRWTMIMPDLTTPVDGNNISLMMSQPIATCPLAVHPEPIGRQWGFVAMAVAAHQCGKEWIKEQSESDEPHQLAKRWPRDNHDDNGRVPRNSPKRRSHKRVATRTRPH